MIFIFNALPKVHYSKETHLLISTPQLTDVNALYTWCAVLARNCAGVLLLMLMLVKAHLAVKSNAYCYTVY